MNTSASFAPQLLHPEQESAPKPNEKPWLRQKQEPAKWYLRFKIYLDLGPKRSLRKALVNEPQDEKATKSDNQAEKKNLSDVSVSGAWSRAAKVWNWKERAESYDLAQIERQAIFVRQVAIQQPFASKAYRLFYLCGMANALHGQTKFSLDLDENVKFTKAMQSLFKDIAHEMEGVDEQTLMLADASAQKRLIELAEKQKVTI